MTQTLHSQPLTRASFAPFGDVIEARGAADMIINAGRCGRHHDLAQLDFGINGRAGISVFDAEPCSFPHTLDMMERHPEGSQAFLPLSGHPFLICVAPENQGAPGKPLAFLTAPYQGINVHRGVWHGVLTPLARPGLFAVIDRIGPTPNLEEALLSPAYVVHE